jgi:hypothetical protein
MKNVLFGLLLAPGIALACPGSDCSDCDKTTAAAAPVDKGEATACAKKAALLGSACRYSTGMMAQRVVAEGKEWSFTGKMVEATNQLASHVAAPFKVGPDGLVNVVANELLDQMTDAGLADKRVTMSGKMLDVDGVQYFVLTDYEKNQT